MLDWLACELIAGDWRLKSLHKQILLSRAYQMSSVGQPAVLDRDPANDLLWRFDRRRLEAEEIRDSILAVHGGLVRTLYGPSVYPVIEPEVLAGQSQPGSGWGDSSPEERSRRSIYIHIKRSLLLPMLATFDASDVDASCPVRFATTQPTQALGLLNSRLLQEESQRFAAALRRDVGADPAAQVREALWRVTQRAPLDVEVQRGCDFLAEVRRRHGLTDDEALRQFCLLALNLNEFLYLD